VQEEPSDPAKSGRSVFAGCATPPRVQTSEVSGLSRVFVPATRFFSLRFFAVSACLVTFTGVLGAADVADVKPSSSGQAANPYEILKDAYHAEDTATSKVTVELSEEDGMNVQTTEFKKTAGDGQKLSRVETIATMDKRPSFKFNQVNLENAGGIWQLMEDRKLALRLQYASERQRKIAGFNPTFGLPPILENNKYILEEVSHNNLACYKIVMTLAEDVYYTQVNLAQRVIDEIVVPQINEGMAKIDSATPKRTTRPLPEAENRTPLVYEFIVGKNAPVIWAVRKFSKRGDLIGKHEYSKSEYNLPLSDDIFEVPKHFKIKTITSISEYGAIIQQQVTMQ